MRHASGVYKVCTIFRRNTLTEATLTAGRMFEKLLIGVIIYLTRRLFFLAKAWTAREPMTNEPISLQQAIIYFDDAHNCINYLAVRRWTDGVICSGYGSKKSA